MSVTVIEKKNFSYRFINYGKFINSNDFVLWLEKNNPIYVNLPKILLKKECTCAITVFYNNKLQLEIKIFEGTFVRIKNFVDGLECYIEDNKIPLEIRENNNINKTNVQYIYDNYIIVRKKNNIFDIFYQDTLEKDSFNLKNISIDSMSADQLCIYKKFDRIIKETKEKINLNVDNMEI
jgi:hypothetical protein